MAYKVIILYQLYMPSYFLGTFTEYPYFRCQYVNYNFFRRLRLKQLLLHKLKNEVSTDLVHLI